MRKAFLDTNVFLRFLVDEAGKQHEECVELFKLIEEEKLKPVICSVVVLEIYFTLKSFYGFDKKKCQQFIERILAVNNLKFVDNFDYFKALGLYSKTGIKFADCLIASLPFFQKGGVIVSYDREFSKLGVQRIEPEEFLKNLIKD